MVALNDVRELGERIAECFDPEKIILFGSHAYGEPHADSDVDLLVIMPFDGRGIHMSLEILNRLNPRFPVDIVVRRPDDVVRRYAEFDPLVREAIDKGVVLYERND